MAQSSEEGQNHRARRGGNAFTEEVMRRGDRVVHFSRVSSLWAQGVGVWQSLWRQRGPGGHMAVT